MRNALELAVCEGGSCGSLRQMAPPQLVARLLSAAALVALAAACDPRPAESFTIHVNHQPNDPRSVAAKDCLKKALCAKFGIAPCVVDAEGAASKLHLRADLSVSVPAARFQPVMWHLYRCDYKGRRDTGLVSGNEYTPLQPNE